MNFGRSDKVQPICTVSSAAASSGIRMKRLAAFALAVLTLPAGAGAETYPINPGYWEVTTNWLGLVVKTERYCVEPKAIPRFLSGPCNHVYHCSYPLQNFHDGRASFEGDIRGHDELYHVRGGGTYSPTTMNMQMSGTSCRSSAPTPR
jgi:hypothetical protein